jgi:pimeloyl-ACP methyl ester carboxylesterase
MSQFNSLPLSVTRAYLTRLKSFDSVYEEASICYRRKRSSSKCYASSSLSGGNDDETGGRCIGKELEAIYARCKSWEWKGYKINYVVEGDGRGPTLLLVHGFGASLGHWRRNIRVLAERYTVYAIDLLGFGASDKPTDFNYTMEGWAELLLDFSRDVIQAPTVLIGNSVGSLACLIAGSGPQNLVRGIVLLNCAGGMNNKAIVDDWRIKFITPLLWLIDFLLKQRKIASALFERLKTRENLMKVLSAVYSNKASVDDELIEVIKKPADYPGALDVFVSVVTGPPGPNPISLIPNISIPILVLWGDEDPFTPLDGPVGKYFSSLPSLLPSVQFFILRGVGHCPHDDRPDLVHEKLLTWLDSLHATLSVACVK